VTPTERNQDARKLLLFFYGEYDRIGHRKFNFSPQDPGTLSESRMAKEDYLTAMHRLLDQGLLATHGYGGICGITLLGVQASERGVRVPRVPPSADRSEREPNRLEN
jgi:hypothetical protein